MSHYTWLGALTALIAITAGLILTRPKPAPMTPKQPPAAPPTPPTPPTTNPAPHAPVEAPTALSFATPKEAYHATRVLCDEAGLSLAKTILVKLPDGSSRLFAPKDIICACVYQESEFHTNPKPNQNKDPKTGQVWSTDYGIVQINDHFHIGPGKDFPSVEYVITRPEMDISWMIAMYKVGRLSQWASYATGAFKKHLINTSPMWALAA